MESKQKFIIDTDIGDDIDDAFALLLAMKLNLDIIGVTTVFRNTDERARIAKLIMKKYGNGYENVPIYAGYSTPLAKNDEKYPHTCQYTDELSSDNLAPESTNPDTAVSFIIDSCKKYGKDLTLIAIGPFTNVAKAIEKDKDALALAGKVVIMGGAYFRQYVDWNVACDVEAAQIMYSGLDNIHCLGADVTHQLRLTDENDQAVCSTESGNAEKYVSELYRLWKMQSHSIGILHDPLAIYYSIDTSICETVSAPIALITDGFAKGITLNVKEYNKAYMNKAYESFDLSHTHILARTVDREKMLKIFMKCFE